MMEEHKPVVLEESGFGFGVKSSISSNFGPFQPKKIDFGKIFDFTLRRHVTIEKLKIRNLEEQMKPETFEVFRKSEKSLFIALF